MLKLKLEKQPFGINIASKKESSVLEDMLFKKIYIFYNGNDFNNKQ